MESILGLEQKRSSLRRTAESIIDKALREGRALRPGEEADVRALQTKIEDCSRTFGHLANISTPRDHGATFIRMVRTLAGKHGDIGPSIQLAEASGDQDLQRALTASIASQGGFAVPLDYTDSVIEALRPLVAVRKLNPLVLPMPNGNLTWPRISTGGSVTYMGEGNLVPQSNTQAFAQLRLVAKKLATFVPLSNDLVRYARPSGDIIIREDLIAAVAATEDYNFLNGNGTEYAPKGLLNWVSSENSIEANQTVSLANTDADLSALELALTNANVRMLRPGWILNPTTIQYLKNLRGSGGEKAYPELDRGLLRGYPFAGSTNMPSTNVLLADFADVVIGEANFVIDAGTQNTYKDAAGNVISAYAQDQTVIRLVCGHDLGMRHQESVAILTSVTWAPSAS